MRTLILLALISFFIQCSVLTPGNQDAATMENVNFSINGLKKAYLDTLQKGIKLEVLFHDPWLNSRDSVKFYIVPCDRKFNHLGDLQRMKMRTYADTLLKEVIWIPTDSIELPVSFFYELGVVYMTAPFEINSTEWELDTVINEYFTFNVYDDREEYLQIVDSFGLEPTVFIRE